jgi:phosphoribosylglycinamide formyltransferase-1
MSRGEPGLPNRFSWRKQTYQVQQVVATWKTSTCDRGELYLRRHWFEMLTTDGTRMKLYCERQAKNRTKPKSRWFIFSLQERTVEPR